MKRFFFSAIAVFCALAISANEGISAPISVNNAAGNDTTRVVTLAETIAQEGKAMKENDYMASLRSIWSKNTYLNISYNTTKLSSDEFPSVSGAFSNEFQNQWGLGLQWGHTFNFHKNPLGNVLFLGLDYTWLDLNFNQYKETAAPASYKNSEESSIGCMPWHNKKKTIDYGMMVGPSLTFYPFTSLERWGTDNIRLQLYFHVGYTVQLSMISEAMVDKGEVSDGKALGHGLYTSFGGNLTWNFVGIGYEFRNDGKLNYTYLDDDLDTGKMKMKQKTGRVYLQFRF